MLLRNLNIKVQETGLCNDAALIILNISNTITQPNIAVESHIGNTALIRRTDLTALDITLPFKLSR